VLASASDLQLSLGSLNPNDFTTADAVPPHATHGGYTQPAYCRTAAKVEFAAMLGAAGRQAGSSDALYAAGGGGATASGGQPPLQPLNPIAAHHQFMHGGLPVCSPSLPPPPRLPSLASITSHGCLWRAHGSHGSHAPRHSQKFDSSASPWQLSRPAPPACWRYPWCLFFLLPAARLSLRARCQSLFSFFGLQVTRVDSRGDGTMAWAG